VGGTTSAHALALAVAGLAVRRVARADALPLPVAGLTLVRVARRDALPLAVAGLALGRVTGAGALLAVALLALVRVAGNTDAAVGSARLVRRRTHALPLGAAAPSRAALRAAALARTADTGRPSRAA